LLEPANEKGLGKFKCDLRNKYSSYTYNELEFNINDSYDNVNGEFWKFNYEIMSILKLLDPIPKKIFQTHKNLDYVLLKYKTRTGYQSWFKYNGDFEYNFYSDENSQKFIQNNFDSKVLEAYEKCPLNVMKADLWRYCVIYYYGGIYADMDAVLMTDPTVFLQPNSLLVFSPETDNIHLCQWTFAAPPKSPVLKSIIDLSVERILSCQEIKGDHIIHFLTGPKVFTDGIEKFLKRMDCKIYPGKFKYENYQNNILHCFNPHYFHNKVIRHLFAGSDDDGWKPERDRVLV
jgi:mannosyltransferase OCH1-like enzyme